MKYDALVSYSNVPVDESRDALVAMKEGAFDFTYLLMSENYDAADCKATTLGRPRGLFKLRANAKPFTFFPLADVIST